ncbi:MAG TPA: DMT family transporter [Bradyrhizobium sp.]|jgi:drug/metabolite transporter (DMT)-like permease
MSEFWGVTAAILWSALGGTSIVATRYVVGATDPLTLGAFRCGIGFAFMVVIALLQGGSWPRRQDWLAVAGLGLLFFGLFPLLFNASLMYTTAARGALALATAPLQTLVVSAMFGVEALTSRKLAGVLVAMIGVAIALLSRLSGASGPEGAWSGDLLMIAAALCLAFSAVWSKPFIRRSGILQFTSIMMGSGSLFLIAISWARGGFAAVYQFDMGQWFAVLYLGIIGSALTWYLWAFALQRTTPTRVAISVTVNPIVASLMGVMLLNEPLRWNLVVGLLAVCVGIAIAVTTGSSASTANLELQRTKPS